MKPTTLSGMCLLTGVLIGTLMTGSSDPVETLECRKLIVRDEQGKARVVLDTTEDGEGESLYLGLTVRAR